MLKLLICLNKYLFKSIYPKLNMYVTQSADMRKDTEAQTVEILSNIRDRLKLKSLFLIQ